MQDGSYAPREQPALQVRGLNKTFARGIRALDDVSLTVHKGEMVALLGPSGSGKSTLIRHLSGLVTSDPKGGHVEAMGLTVQSQGRLSNNVRDVRSRVGVVFQQFNLVGRLSVMTNVLMGSLARVPDWRTLTFLFGKEEKRRAMAALERVGLAQFAWQRASTLSGGQQQRVAIARTLMQDPEIILADEPIASLDPESATRVMELLLRINEEDGITVVVSLHQVEFALRYCRRVIALQLGRVIYDGLTCSVTPCLIRKIYEGRVSSQHEETVRRAFLHGGGMMQERPWDENEEDLHRAWAGMD